jgi:hypothetical protein
LLAALDAGLAGNANIGFGNLGLGAGLFQHNDLGPNIGTVAECDDNVDNRFHDAFPRH